MPNVSVIIPTRNRPRTVIRAVESVLSQTYSDLEVIVIVDGPDPETIEALGNIRDGRVRVIILEESTGASEARNLGALVSLGRWVALLDDDDEWLSTKIEKQIAVAERSGAPYTLVLCSFLLKTTAGQSIVPRRFPRPCEPISEYLFGAPRNGFQTSGFFCSRSLMLEEPWKRLKGLQDIDWFLRVAARPDVALRFVKEPLCLYWTETDSSITSKLGWQTCLEWGRDHRNLMTPRAYSSFIAKVCAPRAAQEKAGVLAIFRLFREQLVAGSPTPASLLMFAAYVLLRYKFRRDLANVIGHLSQRANTLLLWFGISRPA